MDLDGQVEEWVRTGSIRIPPIPVALLRLRTLLATTDHDLSAVVDVVRSDGALAATVLRVANSAFYRPPAPITALSDAVGRIGEAELLRLTMASGLAELGHSRGVLSRLRRQSWHESLSAAVCAALLAEVVGLDRDELFVAGLLHDIGRLVAIEAIEKALALHPSTPPRRGYEWWGLIDAHHLALGALLAEHWKLPEVFAVCIGQHHQGGAKGRFRRQVEAVAAADRIVELMGVRIRVTGDLLGGVVLADRGPLEALARQLPRVPSLVASFQDPGKCAPSELVKLIDEPPPHAGAPRKAFTVALKGGTPAPCLAASPSQLVFASAQRMPEQFLQELELRAPSAELRMWAKVEHCAPARGGFEVRARPYALSPEAERRWAELLAWANDSTAA